jgi:hypothetical protein
MRALLWILLCFLMSWLLALADVAMETAISAIAQIANVKCRIVIFVMRLSLSR